MSSAQPPRGARSRHPLSGHRPQQLPTEASLPGQPCRREPARSQTRLRRQRLRGSVKMLFASSWKAVGHGLCCSFIKSHPWSCDCTFCLGRLRFKLTRTVAEPSTAQACFQKTNTQHHPHAHALIPPAREARQTANPSCCQRWREPGCEGKTSPHFPGRHPPTPDPSLSSVRSQPFAVFVISSGEGTEPGSGRFVC